MEAQQIVQAVSEPCYSMLLLRPFLQLLARPGCSKASLVTSLLSLPDEERIPVRKVLYWLTSEVQLSGDSNLGLRAVAGLGRGAGDVVELAASAAATVGEALQLFLRHIGILNEAADFSMAVEGPAVHVQLRSHVPLPRVAADFQVGAVVAAMRGWLGSLAGVEIYFAHARPLDVRHYHELFAPARVVFGAPCDALRFDSALLSQALPSADPELKKVLLCHAEQTAAELVTGGQLTPRVRKMLLAMLPRGEGDALKISAKLGISRRTLARHLALEGLSFKGLLEKCRHQLALHYLQQTQLDSQEIAALLGYSVTAAFSRAFGRWEGKTPIEYRRFYRANRLGSSLGSIRPLS